MGCGSTSSKIVPYIPMDKEAIYNFKTFNLFSEDKSKRHKVKLVPSIKDIYENKNIKIQLVYFEDNKKLIQKSEGETEFGTYDPQSNSIYFQKFFFIDYYFEKDIPIEFRISGDINATVYTSLPSIMGSRAQTLKKEIENTSNTLEIKGISYKSKIISSLKFDLEVNGKLSEKTIRYCIYTLGNDITPIETQLYFSELRKCETKVFEKKFKQCVIPDIFICPDDNYDTSKIYIELFDCTKHKSLGSQTYELDSLISNKTKVNFDKYREGTLSVERIKNYSFIDYIRGGMQISLSIAIDFTASNQPPKDPKSLHYLGDNNLYEKAIKSCGEIVGNYDNNKMFAVYGFGGKFFGRQEVDHCFPLNNDDNNPEVKGLDEVLKVYRNALNNCELFGPTYFHYIIEKMNNKVSKQVENKEYNKYHILMILTDGIIEDTDDTINALVESSFLPISVIIIGIGKADFTNMNVLDADEEPLVNDKKVTSARDLVQFVPFSKYKDDPTKLREEVLDEIPRQVVEYYQHNNISPGESYDNNYY